MKDRELMRIGNVFLSEALEGGRNGRVVIQKVRPTRAENLGYACLTHLRHQIRGTWQLRERNGRQSLYADHNKKRDTGD